MRIVIVTDAWAPQINGVVRTLQSVRAQLEADGHHILIISPDLYRSIPCPTYPEIRLALVGAKSVGERIADFRPDAIHLSTEGPLCLAVRAWCLARAIPFTTAYHTHFPDYIAQRTKMPAEWFWRYIRWFHGPAENVLVSTASARAVLKSHGIDHVAHWGRGVDLVNFTPDAPAPDLYALLPRPILAYVGRVAVEKNIDAFLRCSHPGSKVVVGDGPAFAALKTKHPDAHFLGSLTGRALAGAYAGADALVFPSRTDTFGLVIIEALACGTPVAAYPVNGPIDLITAETGALDEDLDYAIAVALTRRRSECAAYGRTFSWAASADQFLAGLSPMQRKVDTLAA